MYVFVVGPEEERKTTGSGRYVGERAEQEWWLVSGTRIMLYQTEKYKAIAKLAGYHVVMSRWPTTRWCHRSEGRCNQSPVLATTVAGRSMLSRTFLSRLKKVL